MSKIRSFFVTIIVLAAITAGTSCGNALSESASSPEVSVSVSTSLSVERESAVPTLKVGTGEFYGISDELFGIFFEDINHAADGGLYAQMLKNPSFEYGGKAVNKAMTGWGTVGSGVTYEIMDGASNGIALNKYNPTYIEIDVQGTGDYAGLSNSGYLDGLSFKEGAEYKASFFCRMADGGVSPVRVSIKDKTGAILGESTIEVDPTADWRYYETTVKASADAYDRAEFCIEITSGLLDLDMVTLFPVDTYKGLPVRKDLGEALEALNPKFLRFPGGCAIEGKSLDSMYSWKASVAYGESFEAGDLSFTGHPAMRPQGFDLWGGSKSDPYYMSYGLGFYEFFELCEALDAVAVPVLNAGMTCPIQSRPYIVFSEDSAEFKQTVQDVLDLCEFCRGDETTKWGAVRTAMGHKAPFKLKYIGIGNEQWQQEYFSHYARIEEALKEAAKENPEIYGNLGLVLSNGPSSGSREGWDYLKKTGSDLAAIVDEHYYELPAWFLQNNDRYDSYDRSTKAKVFLGEYAAKSNTLKAALSEASFMTGLERNGDVVALACYAPLFGNPTDYQWNPDLIYFNRKTSYLTADYHVQRLFGCNAGTEFIPSEFSGLTEKEEKSLSGGIGLGSWQTSVSYDDLKVTSNSTGDVLYETGFDTADSARTDGWIGYTGTWKVSDGAYVQLDTKAPKDESTGDATYYVNKDWTDYTLEVMGTILGGAEGFLIPVCVQDTKNMIFWNLGGWGNTTSCLQTVTDGLKSDQVAGTVKAMRLKHNRAYAIKVVISGNNIKCYLDDELYIDYDVKPSKDLYQSVVMDEKGDLIIKIVNVAEEEKTVAIDLSSLDGDTFSNATEVTVLTGPSLDAVNNFAEPEKIMPVSRTGDLSELNAFKLEPYSLTVIRIKR